MISDPQFWVAIAFGIFLLAIFNPARKILSSSLDLKINEIKSNIDEAENIKNETQLSLIDIQKRQNEVELEVKEIHSNVKNKIKTIETQAKIKLTDQTYKKELLAKEKIEQMIRDANLAVQKNIIKTSIDATIAILEKKINDQEKHNLINQSIKDLEKTLKN